MKRAGDHVKKVGRTFRVDDAGALWCDVDTLVDTRLLIQANSGGGKSVTIRRILEQTHGFVQQIVLDLEGDFATLREKFDYVYAAKSGADTVAQPRSAALLATRLLELRVSAIIDLYELQAHERIRFVRLFLESMMNAPKSLWHPVLVVVDEAHLLCPQTGSAESAAAVIDLACRGRKRGFCAVLATQRLQKLHKDAAAECNNKLIGRTNLDLDLARACDELGFPKARWNELRGLPPGQFFATGPAFSVPGVVPVKVGKVLTTHPSAGVRKHAKAPPPPTSAIRALLPKLADLPAEAEEQTQTMDALQKENATLKRELAAQKKVVPPPPKPLPPVRVEVPVIDPKTRTLMTDLRTSLDGLMKKVSVSPRSMERWAQPPKATATEIRAAAGITRAQERVALGAMRDEGLLPKRGKGEPPYVVISKPDVLPKGQRAILTVLAQSDGGSSKSRTAILAGYSPGGGGFNNYLGEMRKFGYITGTDPLEITDDGRHALGDYQQLPTGRDLVDFWLAKCDKAERAIISVLVDVYPDSLVKADLAERAGYAPDGGGFNNALGRLRTMELIQGRGELRVVDALGG